MGAARTLNRVARVATALALAALAGCVGVRSGGQKIAAIDQAIDRIGVIVELRSFKGADAASKVGNREVRALLPQLADRIPRTFAANRIQSAGVYVANEKAVPTALESYAHLLRIWPQASSWNGPNNATLTFDAELYDSRSRLLVWSGHVRYGSKFYGHPDAALADLLAVELIGQLVEDGVLALRTPAPLLAQAAATPAVAPTPVALPRSRSVAVAVAASSRAESTAGGGSASVEPKRHARRVPAATAYAAADDVLAVPVRPEGKERYRHYLGLPSPKAFIVYADGGWRFWSNDPNAMTKALDFCARDGKTCWLYAVDNQVVWDAAPSNRIGRTSQLSDPQTP